MAQERLQELFLELPCRDNCATEHPALTIHVFGAGIDHDVGSEFQRRLEDRRGKDVVDDKAGLGLVGQFTHRADVDDLEGRIGGRFHEDRPGFGAECFLPGLQVIAINQRVGDAEARQNIGDDLVAGTEQRPRRDNMVSSFQLACQRPKNSCHP